MFSDSIADCIFNWFIHTCIQILYLEALKWRPYQIKLRNLPNCGSKIRKLRISVWSCSFKPARRYYMLTLPLQLYWFPSLLIPGESHTHNNTISEASCYIVIIVIVSQFSIYITRGCEQNSIKLRFASHTNRH